MQNETMGKLIAEKRKALGLTQADLAARLGVTDKAVSKWERDLSCPDVSTLPRLGEALGLSVDELLQSKTPAQASTGGLSALLPLILSGVCLAMGVAVAVLSLLGELDTKSGLLMLGIGLACAGLLHLEKK